MIYAFMVWDKQYYQALLVYSIMLNFYLFYDLVYLIDVIDILPLFI